MARDLPGFYWDAERNRYFPIRSKPAGPLQKSPQPPQPTQSQNITTPAHVRRLRSIWSATESRKNSLFEHQRITNRHDLLGLHYTGTANVKEQRVPTFGAIKSFVSTTVDSGQCFRLMGDNRGWIFSNDPEAAAEQQGDGYWTVEMCLNSDSDTEISSISMSDSYSLVTTFGPVSRMRFQQLGHSNAYILTAQNIHDIRCSHLTGTGDIIVGAKQGAVHINETFTPTTTRNLKTHSDVFSVTRQRDLVFAGVRNGDIHRFDLRVPGNHGTKGLFGNNKPRSPVLHVQLINEIQLLTSHMNGELLMYDIRYIRHSNPILQFTGHINTQTARLGIATDPDDEFLFAAGQDYKIRGWSLRTGNPLTPLKKSPTSNINKSSTNSDQNSANLNAGTELYHFQRVDSNPLLAVFDDPIETMQVTRENSDLCLWAGGGKQLWQFNLGCRE